MRQIVGVLFGKDEILVKLWRSNMTWFEFKVQCLQVFCCHGNKPTILLLNSIFRTTPYVSSKNVTLFKSVKSQRSYGFLITKEPIFRLPSFGLFITFSLLEATSHSTILLCVRGCDQRYRRRSTRKRLSTLPALVNSPLNFACCTHAFIHENRQ